MDTKNCDRNIATEKIFVGWVEERNPTPIISGFVGFRQASTQPTSAIAIVQFIK